MEIVMKAYNTGIALNEVGKKIKHASCVILKRNSFIACRLSLSALSQCKRASFTTYMHARGVKELAAFESFEVGEKKRVIRRLWRSH